MFRNPAWLYKTFIVGVIVLFIGLGVQPAFAVTPNTSEIEDDCELCPSIKKIKNLVDIKENKKISNIIDEILENYNHLKIDTLNGNYRPICSFLNILMLRFMFRVMFIFRIIENSPLFGIIIDKFPDLSYSLLETYLNFASIGLEY